MELLRLWQNSGVLKMKPWRAGVLLCRQCGWFSAWRSRKKGGQRTIDTPCRVCGARLRHTFSPDPNRPRKSITHGRGAHTRRKSVSRAWQCSPKEVMKYASDLNKRRQLQLAKRDGVDLPVETKGWGFDE
jgi:hypothetical protein